MDVQARKKETDVHAGSAKGLAIKVALFVAVLVLAMLWVRSAAGQEAEKQNEVESGRTAIVLNVEGPIGPATRDYLTRSMEKAAEGDAELVIIRMDTPGGLDASTRDIIKAILASPVAVVTYEAWRQQGFPGSETRAG